MRNSLYSSLISNIFFNLFFYFHTIDSFEKEYSGTRNKFPCRAILGNSNESILLIIKVSEENNIDVSVNQQNVTERRGKVSSVYKRSSDTNFQIHPSRSSILWSLSRGGSSLGIRGFIPSQ